MNTENLSINNVQELRFRLDKTVKSGMPVSHRICNLNCIWCHHDFLNHEICQKVAISNDQFVSIVKDITINTGIPRASVRISGDGEPTMIGQEELLDLIYKLKNTPNVIKVKLTTNGVLLNPVVSDLVEAGLDSVTISLNSLDPDIYFFYARAPHLNKVLSSIDKCLRLGLQTKINLACI